MSEVGGASQNFSPSNKTRIRDVPGVPTPTALAPIAEMVKRASLAGSAPGDSAYSDSAVAVGASRPPARKTMRSDPTRISSLSARATGPAMRRPSGETRGNA